MTLKYCADEYFDIIDIEDSLSGLDSSPPKAGDLFKEMALGEQDVLVLQNPDPRFESLRASLNHIRADDFPTYVPHIWVDPGDFVDGQFIEFGPLALMGIT